MADILSVITNLQKTVYLPVMQDAINLSTALLAQLSASPQKMNREQQVFAIRVGNNQGIGSRFDYTDTPTAGKGKWLQSTVTAKFHYADIEISGPTVESTRSSDAAFARIIGEEMTGTINQFRLDQSRQIFGNGQGKLCLVNGAHTTTKTLTVDNGLSATDGTTRRLEVDMLIDVWNPSNVREAAGVEIASVDSATQVTLSSNVALTTDGTVTRQNVRDSSNYAEMEGLENIVKATGALQGLNPGTTGQEKWKSFKVTTSVGALDDQNMHSVVQAIEEGPADEAPDYIVTTNGVLNSFRQLYEDNVRFEPQQIRGGYKAITFASGGKELPMIVDYDCPKGLMYFLANTGVAFFELAPMRWREISGQTMWPVQNRDAFASLLLAYRQLGTLRRWENGLLSGITETT